MLADLALPLPTAGNLCAGFDLANESWLFQLSNQHHVALLFGNHLQFEYDTDMYLFFWLR